MIAGALPGSWGGPGAFPALQYMGLAINAVTGTLPETWAAPGKASLIHSLHACTARSYSAVQAQKGWSLRVFGVGSG